MTTSALSRTLSIAPAHNNTHSADAKKSTKLVAATSPYPFAPNEVNLNDLDNNGLLINTQTLETITHLPLQFKFKKTTYRNGAVDKKGDIDAKFSVLVLKNKENKTWHIPVYRGHIHKSDTTKLRLGQNPYTKTWYAIKMLKKTTHTQLEYQINEHLGDAIGENTRTKPAKKNVSGYEQHIFATTYKPGMNLYTFIYHHPNARLNVTNYRWTTIACDMIRTLMALHKCGFYQIDIKTPNYLICPISQHISLIDLGDALPVTQLDNRSARGTPYYIAPEIARKYLDEKRTAEYSEASEVYALAKSVAEILDLAVLVKTNEEIIKDILDLPRESPASDAEIPQNMRKFFDLTLRLVDEKSGEFCKNKKIPDPSVRRYTLGFLKLAMHKNPKRRPSMNQFMEFMTNIDMRCNRALDKIKRIALFNASEFFNANNKEALIATLKHFDEVWIIDANLTFTPKHLIALKRNLAEHHIEVGTTLFHNPPNENLSAQALAATIPQVMAQQFPNNRCSFFFVSACELNPEQSAAFVQATICPIIATRFKPETIEAFLRATKINYELYYTTLTILGQEKMRLDYSGGTMELSAKVDITIQQIEAAFKQNMLTFVTWHATLVKLAKELKVGSSTHQAVLKTITTLKPGANK